MGGRIFFKSNRKLVGSHDKKPRGFFNKFLDCFIVLICFYSEIVPNESQFYNCCIRKIMFASRPFGKCIKVRDVDQTKGTKRRLLNIRKPLDTSQIGIWINKWETFPFKMFLHILTLAQMCGCK